MRVLIDTSLMTGVCYDPEMSAFAVDAGTTLGEVYRKLFLGWGVTIPAGESPDIGVGGHVLGGAFGFLCREHGLAADHLYAVEVVVVDAAGTARSLVATREPSDPNRELWWAHTGGGGGNFGIVTRYWFRSPGAHGTDPASLLPRAPGSVLTFRVGWSWEDFDEGAFARLMRNHGEWCERNSTADAPGARLFSILFLHRRQSGKLELRGPRRPARFTDRQIQVAHHFLTRSDQDVPGGMLGLATYGGKVNTLAPDATASAQRDSILTTSCNAGWMDPRDEDRNMAWVRAFYRELFADSGGVPAPDEANDGAFINHPDADLADSRWNTSGVPWYTLYYKDNYPRLQRVKARWDPRNVFRHALSIRLP